MSRVLSRPVLVPVYDLSSEVATWFIIFTTGTVLHTNGITTITTADQAAAALEPLVHSVPSAGLLAKLIFATGILGVGLLGVPASRSGHHGGIADQFSGEGQEG